MPRCRCKARHESFSGLRASLAGDLVAQIQTDRLAQTRPITSGNSRKIVPTRSSAESSFPHVFSGNPGEFGLDPRLIHSGVTLSRDTSLFKPQRREPHEMFWYRSPTFSTHLT